MDITQTMLCLAIQIGIAAIAGLFAVAALLNLAKIRALQRHLSEMVEKLAVKSKELEDEKRARQELTFPFVPDTSKPLDIVFDLSGKITQINKHALELFGYAEAEIIGRNASGTIFPPTEKKDSLQANIISRIFSNPRFYVEYETQNIKKSGEVIWIAWTNRVTYDNKGNPTELRATGFDITRRKRLEEDLRHLTAIDPLTGVLNRQAFLDIGARELKRSIRYGREVAILLLKLNYLRSKDEKTLVATLDNKILKQTVALCQKSIRNSDSIGRIGEVEFAIVLPETPAENAIFLAQRLKQKIQEKNLEGASDAFVTATFGVTGKMSPDDTIDTLLLRASGALQEADKNTRKKLTTKEKKG